MKLFVQLQWTKTVTVKSLAGVGNFNVNTLFDPTDGGRNVGLTRENSNPYLSSVTREYVVDEELAAPTVCHSVTPVLT